MHSTDFSLFSSRIPNGIRKFPKVVRFPPPKIVTARHQKTPLSGAIGAPTQVGSDLDSHLKAMVSETTGSVKKGVEVAGFAPAGPWVRIQIPHSSTPTPKPLSQIGLSPSTLAGWIAETDTSHPSGRTVWYIPSGDLASHFVGVWDERTPKQYHEWKGFTKFKEGFGGNPLYYPIPALT